MKAVILVGGLGTRLRPLTLNTPKSMVPVLNAPFLEHVLRRLSSCGVRDIVLALSHLAPAVEGYFGDGGKLGLSIKYVVENSPLGTAGAARNALGHIHDACLVMNGDIFTGLDVRAMKAYHDSHRARVTIALTGVDNPCAYGLVETHAGGRVRCFVEKPAPDQVTTNMINAGTYIVEPEVLAGVPEGTIFSFEKQLFPSLLAKGEAVYAFRDDSYWIDIGTPAKYHQLNRDLLCGQAGSRDASLDIAITGQDVPATGHIEGPVLIGKKSIVGEEVTITGPTVIGPGCRVEKRAFVVDSIIWQNAVIGAGCRVVSSVIANDCVLGPDCRLEDCVIGDHVTLPPGYRNTGGQVWPESSR